MGVIVDIDVEGERAYGLLVVDTVERAEWHVAINEVPRLGAFCYGDLVAVDGRGATAASFGPRRFLRVVDRGRYQASLRVTHTLGGDLAVGAWLDRMEHAGWAIRDDEAGVVWVAAPARVDARAVLSTFSWVTDIKAPYAYIEPG